MASALGSYAASAAETRRAYRVVDLDNPDGEDRDKTKNEAEDKDEDEDEGNATHGSATREEIKDSERNGGVAQGTRQGTRNRPSMRTTSTATSARRNATQETKSNKSERPKPKAPAGSRGPPSDSELEWDGKPGFDMTPEQVAGDDADPANATARTIISGSGRDRDQVTPKHRYRHLEVTGDIGGHLEPMRRSK